MLDLSKELIDGILDGYGRKLSLRELSRRYGISRTTIKKILNSNKGIASSNIEYDEREKKSYVKMETIFREDIDTLKERTKVGDVLMVATIKSTNDGVVTRNVSLKVLEKYPFLVQTDKGVFRWQDIAIGVRAYEMLR